VNNPNSTYSVLKLFLVVISQMNCDQSKYLAHHADSECAF